ncbi:MAG TPA: hypothetical protein VHS59_10800 [Bacillota bacterium]|nr:hypothetical protein [Bacillota bacterium]
MNKSLYVLLGALLAALVMTGCSSKTAETPQETPKTTEQAAVPTPAAKERVVVDIKNQKNGCADCHAPGKTIKTSDGKTIDASLSGEVKNISGHPPVSASATVKDCLACHNLSQGSKEAIANKLHDVHLNSEVFTVSYKQTCSACHDMKTIKQ